MIHTGLLIMCNHLTISSSPNRNQIKREISNDSIFIVLTGFSTLKLFSDLVVLFNPISTDTCHPRRLFIVRLARVTGIVDISLRMICVDTSSYRRDKIIANEFCPWRMIMTSRDSSSIALLPTTTQFFTQTNPANYFYLGESRNLIHILLFV
jgi:hypothetical protein